LHAIVCKSRHDGSNEATNKLTTATVAGNDPDDHIICHQHLQNNDSTMATRPLGLCPTRNAQLHMTMTPHTTMCHKQHHDWADTSATRVTTPARQRQWRWRKEVKCFQRNAGNDTSNKGEDASTTLATT
jgi:hypothetical protein